VEEARLLKEAIKTGVPDQAKAVKLQLPTPRQRLAMLAHNHQIPANYSFKLHHSDKDNTTQLNSLLYTQIPGVGRDNL
jgi:hypothetical protein